MKSARLAFIVSIALPLTLPQLLLLLMVAACSDDARDDSFAQSVTVMQRQPYVDFIVFGSAVAALPEKDMEMVESMRSALQQQITPDAPASPITNSSGLSSSTPGPLATPFAHTPKMKSMRPLLSNGSPFPGHGTQQVLQV